MVMCVPAEIIARFERKGYKLVGIKVMVPTPVSCTRCCCTCLGAWHVIEALQGHVALLLQPRPCMPFQYEGVSWELSLKEPARELQPWQKCHCLDTASTCTVVMKFEQQALLDCICL